MGTISHANQQDLRLFNKYYAHILPNGNIMIKQQEFVRDSRLPQQTFPQKITYFGLFNPSESITNQRFSEPCKLHNNITLYSQVANAGSAIESNDNLTK